MTHNFVWCAQMHVHRQPLQCQQYPRLTALRLLMCAQWPAHEKRVLDLNEHESAALTWCGLPAVSTPRNAALDKSPAKHKREHQTLDSFLYPLMLDQGLWAMR